jgi:glycosyltransferase involved in cell wall biosynthesis
MTATITITVVVTAHSEGRLLRPTLRSIERALRVVVSAGESAELLLLCDRPDDPTLAEAESWGTMSSLPFEVRVEVVDNGESGASRNAGAEEARGEFVAFVDGDDLVSENYLSVAISVLRKATVPTILHPEYVISFGARSLIWRTESAATHGVSYRDLIRHNLWPSSAVTRRELFLIHPYRSLPPAAGYGPEDWIWNIDTSAEGIVHNVAPGTVFFYRVRARGGVNNGHAVSILPPFDFDGLRKSMPLSESKLTHATTVSLPSKIYQRMLPSARLLTRPFSYEVKHVIYRAARAALRLATGRTPAQEQERTVPPQLLEALLSASEIEPAISWTATRITELEAWVARDDGYAEILESALDEIGDRAGALVAVPWIGIGGADMVALNYANALQATERFEGRTTILGTYLSERTVHETISGSLKYVHLDERWLSFPLPIRRRLIAQLIVLLRPEILISVNCFHLTESMQMHSPQIADTTHVYATLFAFDRIGEGYPTNPITDDSQREFLDSIDGLISDNTDTARRIDEILALPESKVFVHRQPTAQTPIDLARGTRAYNNEYFSTRNPFRVIWPHRLDSEKRPDVLPRIAEEIARRNLPIVIDVWGQRVLTSDGDTLMADLDATGVIYRGAYQGGLTALDTYSYHALLLTSQSEGLPLVLVQSLLRGLPVVASGVGGVPDIIVDGVTGLLTTGPDDITGYVEALQKLLMSLELRRSIIEAGYRFATDNHSWEAFRHQVEELYEKHRSYEEDHQQ